MSELNRIAQNMFGQDYSKLSPFGQYTVSLELQRGKGVQEYEKDKIIQAQAARITELERNNKDLWDENEDLQLELQRIEDDEHSSARNTGTRKAQDRARLTDEVSAFPDSGGRGGPSEWPGPGSDDGLPN